MELDELKTAWMQQQERLCATLRLNDELVRAANAHPVRAAMNRFSLGIALELAINVLGLLWLGSFAADHYGRPGYMIPAALLGIYAIVMIADAVGQIVAARSLDYDEPVVPIQKRLAALRVRHVRTVRAILLTAPLVWTPLLIVALAAFGVDPYATLGPAYLAANVGFGAAFLAAAYAAARRYGRQIARTRVGLWLADALAGRTLTSALESLDNVLRFQEESVTA